MLGTLDFDAALEPTLAEVREGLERVVGCFDRELAGDLPVVVELCRHVAAYRGKMLRPVLVLASGLASSPGRSIGEAHIVCASVVEMIHMATLVHDDVLDEAESRRGAPSVGKLHGNEAAVILGDYLIASAYRLCSLLESQAVAVLVGDVSRTLCAGELLQLHHRGNASIDEDAYFAIVERKTGSLIGLSCRLGAMASGAPAEVADRLDAAGRKLGIAFQIQDDVLDLTSRASTLGKPVGRDVAMGKLTLPLIRWLDGLAGSARGEALALIADAGRHPGAREELRAKLGASGAIEDARLTAGALVADATELIAALPESTARALLERMARAVVDRGA